MLCFLVLALLPVSLAGAASLPESDATILLAFKNGLTFPAGALSTWVYSNPSSFCSWRGIQCDSGSRVAQLDLSDLNLTGTLPSLLGLDRLVNLSLAGNNLEGAIQLSNMPSLQFVNISNNQFSGGVEWDYATLPSLQVLDVYNNNFTSTLPLGLAGLSGLHHLDLGGNYFFGEIPKVYGSMASLEYLSLAGNDLSGRIPGELGNLTKLEQLYLGYYNKFDGGIPAELGNLGSLTHLDVSSCELKGEIPSELGNLQSLDTLFAHTNLLTGNIPPSLGNLTALMSLDLSNNALDGEVPLELASLKRLKLLNLFLNKLHGNLPEFFAEYPELEVLSVFTNNFTGSIPSGLGSNGKLRVIDLSTNQLTGTMPTNICSNNQLKVLIMLKNSISGPIPDTLGSCSSLVRVRLGQNNLNGSIPRGFLYLPQLDLVELQNNYLSGSLGENPDPNHQATQLSQLDLSNNLLSGPLPGSISNMSSLQTLLLRDNHFDGSIPPAVGTLSKLVKLDFSWNAFSGAIPKQVARCSKLTYLDLSVNNLSGRIPGEISAVAMLNYLNLSRNHLEEAIPESIAGMKSLTSVDFSYNDLSGKLPDTGQFAYFNASAFAGNPRLCGAAMNLPCDVRADGVAGSGVGKPASGILLPNHYKVMFLVGLLACSLTFAATVAYRVRYYSKSEQWEKEGAADHGRDDDDLNASGAKWKLTAFRKVGFTAADVVECVKDSNIIGRGGAGVVYKGRLRNGDEIAIKKLSSSAGCGRGRHHYHDRGLGAEIRTLGNIRHRNIVRLLAVCSGPRTNLLVYEYMRNGSLGEALHGRVGGGVKGSVVLVWDQRYMVAVESARGLCYLHHDCSPIIVHRDVKSNNILLGSEARVADFGLAKFLSHDGGATECMSAIAGSYGYIAPEYAYTLKVDEKSDVYSYGVVLLELLTGRKPVGDFGDGVMDIVQWARKISTPTAAADVMRILDPKLLQFGEEVPPEEATHLFSVAMQCVRENSTARPTMREVVQMLTEFPRQGRNG